MAEIETVPAFKILTVLTFVIVAMLVFKLVYTNDPLELVVGSSTMVKLSPCKNVRGESVNVPIVGVALLIITDVLAVFPK